MRVVLTSLAVALVATLCVALVAPLLIDWSSHRAEIAARLSALTGGEVTLGGEITARLLPTPYVEIGEGAVAGPGPDAPRLTFASARLELALVKLASGAIRFTDIRLDRPVLTLRRRADGALNLPQAPPGRAGGIGFDRLVVSDGKVVVEASQGAPRREIDGIALIGDASSLAGPYHVSGSFEGPERAPVVFRLATEPKADGRIPVRLAVDSGKSWPALEFDGAADGSIVSGAAKLTGAVATPEGETPWRAAGRLVADSSRVALDPAQFRFGPDERGVQAEGSAALALASPPRLSLDIRAKQPNLDALLRRKGEDAAAPARALSLLLAALSPALDPARPHAVDARLSASQTILGGATLPDLSASLKAAPGSPLAIRLDLGLPGQTRLAANGRFEPGAAAKFVGTVDASSGDFDLFRQWAGVGAPAFAARASALADALPYRSGRLAGPVEVSAVGFSGQGLTITLDRSTLTGGLAFTEPVGAEPGRLFLDLATPSLDLASLPNVGLATIMLSDLDLSVSLGADALHVADVNDAALETGSLSLKLTKTGPDVRLDRFRVENLGGASVEAEGASGEDGISLAGHIRAGQLRDFAALVARLAPGPWTSLVAGRADLLSPAALAFEAHGQAGSVTTFSAKGSLGRTQASLSLEPGPRGSGQAIAASLDAPDTAALLRQLGLPASDQAKSGSAHVTLDAAGTFEGGYDVNGAATLAGVDLSGRGRFLPQAQGDAARLFGSVKAKGANVAPLLATLGFAPQGGPALGPADASADLTLRGDDWAVSKLAASVAGVKAKGEFTYHPAAAAAADALAAPDISRALEAVGGPGAPSAPPSHPEIAGELSLDRLSLGGLVSSRPGAARAAEAGRRLVGRQIRRAAAQSSPRLDPIVGRRAFPDGRLDRAKLPDPPRPRQGPARTRRDRRELARGLRLGSRDAPAHRRIGHALRRARRGPPGDPPDRICRGGRRGARLRFDRTKSRGADRGPRGKRKRPLRRR